MATATTIPKTGIVGGNMTTTAAPTTSGTGNITQVQNYTAAQLGDPTRWEIDNNQTVQGQIQGIIAQNSPLSQMAETRSLQQMNARGLVNSSLAVTAGQAALYDAALPIAQQDAETYAKAAGYNADTANKFAVENVNSQNKALEFNATAGNRAGEVNATNETTRRGQDVQLEGTKYASDRQLEGTRYASDQQLAGTRYDADRRLQGTQYSSDRQLEGTRYAADSSAAASRYNADTSAAASRYNADQQLAGTRLSAEANVQAERIRGDYNNLIQTNAQAASLYQQYIVTQSSIDQSNLDPASKEAARYNASIVMQDAMKTLSATTGVTGLSFQAEERPATVAPAPTGNMQNSVTAQPSTVVFDPFRGASN